MRSGDVESISPDDRRNATDSRDSAWVELSQVQKSFVVTHADGELQRVTAVDGVSLSVARGQFVSLVGPSGCGKTTTLRMIAGLEAADAGSIRIGGKDVRGPSRLVSLVFQTFNLLPWRTIRQNIELGLELQGMRDDARKDRVDRYIDLVNLREFTNHYPHQLSGGMQQRVGLARALAVESPVLLMDEPFGSLDAMTREVLQRELLMILDETEPRRTVFFVTHSVDEAIYLSDRVVVFASRPGRVVKDLAVTLRQPRYEGDDVRLTERFLELRGALVEGLTLNHLTHLDH